MACALLAVLCSTSSAVRAEDAALRGEALAAMRKAGQYYHHRVALRGGYVYYYSPDLSQRLGEGAAGKTQIWVQPPGTPTVGMAFLRAYEATGEKQFLDAATDAADALIYGQLKSGCWTNRIDFDPRGEGVALYRNGKGRGKDNSTLDDGSSQAAIRLMIQADRAHEFNHREIHEAAQVALDALLAAQFANGAFPQVWTGPVADQPVMKANYPDYDWRTEGRIKNYWDMYTLNDGLAGDVAPVLIEAHEIYGAMKYKDSLRRLGDFLLLAQMPDPQPAWAQQYNYQMQPIWARRFEPAAVAGRESMDVIETLMLIYQQTGDEKYLAPIPRAVAYLKKSLLKDGRLARYYELKSNRPLYMSRSGRNYTLTYDDSRLPSHYGWKVESRLDEIERAYKRLKNDARPAPAQSADLENAVRQIVSNLDSEGRWISTYQGQPLVGQPKFAQGGKFIASEVFSQNMETLARYVGSSE